MPIASKRKAQPPPPPPAPPSPISAPRVFSTKEQEAFNQEGDDLAAKLGWWGPEENVLNEITVKDAQGYLRKIFHEVHQSALTPERDTPEAATVCTHLGVTDQDEMKIVGDAIKAAYDRELADAPANPTALPMNPAASSMGANVTANAAVALGNFQRGEEKARGS